MKKAETIEIHRSEAEVNREAENRNMKIADNQ